MSHSTARRLPSRRLATIGGLTVVIAALTVSAGLVWKASYSAFSSRTATPTNNWTAGTVDLANNRTGSALWNITGLKPGLTDSKCITVTSSGNLPSEVRIYTTSGSMSTTNGLTSAIVLGIEQGSFSGGTNCDTNFNRDASGVVTGGYNIITIGTAWKNYASGLGSWTTTGGANETKVYRFTWTFDPPYNQDAVDTYQGGTAAIGFTWEARNT